ncbi:MAG: D-alanyl-D-alanine carboxypeptidase family protein [Lachnospiraceae bacterium]|nr:D-alanyl-D-alanine carboxypeptidase family protein [Lachnospiraceae bacterium]
MGVCRKTGAVILSFMLICMIWVTASFAEEQDGRQEELTLYAQSAVLMDGKTGRVLWEKNGDVIRPMASTTKIMTGILALELGLGEEDRIVTASSLAASQPQVHLGMRTGQRFYTRDLLYSLMLESHNDSAVAIAEAAAGSVPEFAQRMNQKARELGCDNTWFITPNGLDQKAVDEDGTERIHSTTAEDLARILCYCISESPKAQEFLAITRTSDYSFQDADQKGNYSCHNHNALLTMMEGAMTGKTGFTGGAGYCYTGAVEDQGRVFVIALLGCGWPPHKTYKWSDARTLISYGKENYQYRELERQVDLAPLTVRKGVQTGWGRELSEGDSAKVRLQESAGEPADSAWRIGSCRVSLQVQKPAEKLTALISSWDQVRIVKRVPDYLEAPVEAGQTVGEIVYYLNDQVLASYPVIAVDSAERFTYSWCLRQVGRLFFVS